MNPFTIIVEASSSESPRLIKIEELFLPDFADTRLVFDIRIVLANLNNRIGVGTGVLIKD